MEFEPQTSITKVLETFANVHGLSRASVWLTKQNALPARSSQIPDKNDSFELGWSWAESNERESPTLPETFGSAFEPLMTLHDEVVLLTKEGKPLALRQGRCNCGCAGRIVELEGGGSFEAEEVEWIAIYTPLIAADDQAQVAGCEKEEDQRKRLVGILVSERATQKISDDEEKEAFQSKNQIKRIVDDFRLMRNVAAELIATIHTEAPRWGTSSLPSDTTQFPYDLEETLRRFMEVFEQYRKKPQHDLWDVKGRVLFEQKVITFMKAGKPIPLVLPSFPFKSSNTIHKVIARHADMAEKLALDSLKHFCEQVRSFYPPGVALVIVSDGRVYNSQFEIETKYVLSFQREIRRLNTSPDVSIVGLGDFLPLTPEETKREALIALFGQSMDKVEEILKRDADFNRVYCGFKKFMNEELSFPENATVKQRRERCAAAAKEMMKSNDAYGRLVECLFPHHIRLSIHSHSNVEKVGITMTKMTAGSDMQWGTPWHNCAVLRKTGEWELIRKNMARVRGYEIRYTEDEFDLPYYYEGENCVPLVVETEKDEDKLAHKTRVFIGDVNHEVTEEDLREFCTPVGDIKAVEYCRHKKRPFSHAFIEFANHKQAVWAVENLHGASLCGGVVRVEFPKEKA